MLCWFEQQRYIKLKTVTLTDIWNFMEYIEASKEE